MYTMQNNQLFCENLSLENVAQKFGTPLYVYSLKQLNANIQKIKGTFETACPQGMVCYAVKANSHRAFLNHFSSCGMGFDIVSHGEMQKVLEVQGHLNNVVYSGSAKTPEEIKSAIQNDIFMLNAESLWEVEQASIMAQSLNKTAHVALRVNPYVDPQTHKHISTGMKGAKFGIPKDDILDVAKAVSQLKNVQLIGLSCHIGSMVSSIQPFLDMLAVIKELAIALKQNSIPLKYIDLGGGFPITYIDEQEINYQQLFTAYNEAFAPLNLIPIIEPGRSLVGNTGALIAEVVHIKESAGVSFAFLNAGFTELIRPALYQATHKIIPLKPVGKLKNYSVVGPICESTDLFAEDTPLAIEDGSLVLIENAGAYGACMASNYNMRPKVAEVLINENKMIEITPRQNIESLWQSEAQSF
ncbi:MAG: diaminopimelate decarboxylase [Brevinema sp.]